MADNNEEQYLDQLLNSLMDSNTDNPVNENQEENASVLDEGNEELHIDNGSEADAEAIMQNDSDADTGTIVQNDSEADTEHLVLEDGEAYDEPFVLDESDVAGADYSDSGESVSENAGTDVHDSGEENTVMNQEEIEKLLNSTFSEDNSNSGESSAGSAPDDIMVLDDSVHEANSDDNSEADSGTDNDLSPDELMDKADDGLLDLLNEIKSGTESGDGESSGQPADKKKGGIFAKLFGRKSKEQKSGKSDDGLMDEGKKNKPSKEKKKKGKKKKAGTEPDTETSENQGNEAVQDNMDLINAVYSTEDLESQIPESTEEEEVIPKKEKKQKKPKEKKPPKPKKPAKPKKEKRPPKPSELVKVTPFTFIGIAVFVAIITAAIWIGTSVFSYGSNVKAAKIFFENGKYEQAFDRISGLDIKEKDKDIYNKIRVVMSIYSDYSSYVNYNKVNMKVEALDSLIQGLKHYHEYYEDAKKHDVLEQYNKIYELFVSTLLTYGISEEDAEYYSSLESEEQYTDILKNIGGIVE